MTVRCKFKLNSVTEKLYGTQKSYDAAFSAVYSNTPGDPNKAFWDATPSGEFRVTTIKNMPWRLGEEYYIDVTPAIEPASESVAGQPQA